MSNDLSLRSFIGAGVALLLLAACTQLQKQDPDFAAIELQCKCRCSCVIDASTSFAVEFACSSNSDTCNYRDACEIEGQDPGLLRNCSKIWVQK